jgi:hypothetical protein
MRLFLFRLEGRHVVHNVTHSQCRDEHDDEEGKQLFARGCDHRRVIEFPLVNKVGKDGSDTGDGEGLDHVFGCVLVHR